MEGENFLDVAGIFSLIKLGKVVSDSDGKLLKENSMIW
jgi:hypothetical protein